MPVKPLIGKTIQILFFYVSINFLLRLKLLLTWLLLVKPRSSSLKVLSFLMFLRFNFIVNTCPICGTAIHSQYYSFHVSACKG